MVVTVGLTTTLSGDVAEEANTALVVTFFIFNVLGFGDEIFTLSKPQLSYEAPVTIS